MQSLTRFRTTYRESHACKTWTISTMLRSLSTEIVSEAVSPTDTGQRKPPTLWRWPTWGECIVERRLGA
jgi:hypothetical protein